MATEESLVADEAAGRTAAPVASMLRRLRPLLLIGVLAALVGMLMQRYPLALSFDHIRPMWLMALVAGLVAVGATLIRRRKRVDWGAALEEEIAEPISPDLIVRIDAAESAELDLDDTAPAPASGEEPVRAVIAPPPLDGAGEALPDDAMAEDRLQAPLLGEIGIAEASRRIIAGEVVRALFVSPEGDEAAAVSVMVSREIADAGLRVLTIDLTGSGAVSKPMLEGGALPGITDLLIGAAQFTDAIHDDLFSGCHVIPVGLADPVSAMERASARLPAIMEALEAAYDVVVVECGAADAAAIAQLAEKGTAVFVSVLEANELVAGAADGLVDGGFETITLVSPNVPARYGLEPAE